MGENDVVSHSGIIKGVTGSLFIPGTDVLAKSNNQAELKIRLETGPAVDSEFGTIYVDPRFDTMDGWAEGGKERGLMSYRAGKVVLPPDIPATELSALAQAMEIPDASLRRLSRFSRGRHPWCLMPVSGEHHRCVLLFSAPPASHMSARPVFTLLVEICMYVRKRVYFQSAHF